MENYVYEIATPKGGAYIMPIIILCFLAVLIIVVCIIPIYGMTHTKISVGNGFLTVKSTFYGKKIPLNEINVDGVRKLNLGSDWDKDYRVTLRTNGIGLSGYTVGWMRLHNGHKALVYITDKTNVALIPTAKFDVMFSTNDFDGLKNALSR
jgi:hypothetical protein